jgi:hypothetical protein
MTGSPKECRAHAMACSRLAETLPDGRSRQMFAALTQSCLNLLLMWKTPRRSWISVRTCASLTASPHALSITGRVAVGSSSLVGGFTQLRGRDAKLCTMVPT